MDPNQLLKQMIAFNKAVSDNNFRTLTATHEQTERMVKQFWEKSPLFPEEGKKAVADWMKSYKEFCDGLKSRVDHNFQEAEKYIGNSKPTDKQP